MIEDPTFYQDIVSSRGEKTSIKDQLEICQGGPNIGKLFVNGQLFFPTQLFGGPMLESGGQLYLTRRVRSLFFNGFILCKIDLDAMEWSDTTLKGQLIWPRRIEDNSLYYLLSFDEDSNEQVLKIE